MVKSEYIFTKDKFEQVEAQIEADIVISQYPFTFKALLNNTRKIDLLLDGIKTAGNNFYSSQIIVRSLFEHLFVGYYLFLKFFNDKNDIAGEHYYKIYLISEYLKQEGYNYGITSILENKKSKFDIVKIREAVPTLKDAEQADIDELHRIANQFDIKK